MSTEVAGGICNWTCDIFGFKLISAPQTEVSAGLEVSEMSWSYFLDPNFYLKRSIENQTGRIEPIVSRE